MSVNTTTIIIPEEKINQLKGIFEQDINIVNILVKNYSSIMNFEKFDKMYLDELTTALKLIEPSENSEKGNELSQMLEQTIHSLKIVSATQNSYINEFTQKLIPSLKAYKDEVQEKKKAQKDATTDFEKQVKLGKELDSKQQIYEEELKQMTDNVTAYSSDRAQEYKAFFLHMIYYSMEMHAKCLEELTQLNSVVENFEEEKYKKELSGLIEKKLFDNAN